MEAAKLPRKQCVSCDACRFRKVKCDRRAKIEKWQGPGIKDSMACSVCSLHGLRCTYTQAAPRRRRGKRIEAIQSSQYNDLDGSLGVRPQQDRSTHSGPSKFREHTLSNRSHSASNSKSSSSESPAYQDTKLGSSSAANRDELFGVQGLTRPLLEACVKSYFKYVAPCMPILHAEVFAARYALFFVHYEKEKGVRPFWEMPKEDSTSVDRPLSLLLLLSVSCAGAALLEPPIANFDFKGKFRLQDRLALSFQREVRKHDLLLRLQHEGMDIVEACYIMNDPLLLVLGDDLPSTETIDWNAVKESETSQRDPLRLRPASPEGIVRLIFKMGINMSGKMRENVPPGDNRLWEFQGIYFDDREAFRRCRIFWSVFMQDSFCSMGEQRNVMIGNDDYDLELPRLIPHAEGQYEALFWHNPMTRKFDHDTMRWQWVIPNKGSIQMQPSLYGEFDAYQLEVMLRLAFIVRTVSIRFVSPRSKGKGVLFTDVNRAVNALEAWFQQLPHVVTWEVQSKPLMLARRKGKAGSSNAKAMRNSLRALFVEFIYHGQVLAAWESVDSFGVRQDAETDDALAMFVKSLKLDDGQIRKDISIMKSACETAEPVQRPSRSTARLNDDVKEMTKRRLDRLAAKSLLRLAKVAKESAQLGLIRASRLVFSHIIGVYIMWGCGMVHKLKAVSDTDNRGTDVFPVDAPPGYDQAGYLYKCIEDLIYAMGQIDSYEFAPERVKHFKGMLLAARGGVAFPRDQQAEENAEKEGDLAQTTFRYILHTEQVKASSMDQVAAHSASAPKQRQSTSESSAPSMDIDEVSQMAYAADPSHSDLSTSDGISPFAEDIGDTRESSKDVGDQMLDLDLESITSMATEWLHKYLQTSTHGQVNKCPSREAQDLQAPHAQQQPQHVGILNPTSWSSLTASAPASTTSQPTFNTSEVSSMDEFLQSYANEGPSAATAPGIGEEDLDYQWDNYFANSDAQLWADAQWQGLTDNSKAV